MNKKTSLFRIEANYAVSQASYWVQYCAIGGFTAIYLTYRGLNDSQIGLTTSLSGIMAIIFQLIVSNYCDNHLNVPLKRIISIIFLVSMGAGMLFHYIDLPIGLMIVVFAISTALDASNNGYLNAQLIQFNNVGIEARYGWPRGMGSICYAIAAFLYGRAIEKYTAGILIPIFLIGTLVCIAATICMPNPYKMVNPKEYGAGVNSEKISYFQMLKENRLLRIYLICIMLLGAGQAGGYTFMIRVIEGLGGGTAEYGISEFIRAGVEMPMLFASPLLLKKYASKTLVTVSFFANGVRVWLAAIAPNVGFIYGMSFINMLCSGLYVFASVLYVNSIVGPREKVRAQSLVVLCISLGSIIGNAVAGVMIDAVGLKAMLWSTGSLAILAGIIMIISDRRSDVK